MSTTTIRTHSREEQSLDQYLQEIGSVPLLKAEEEIELARNVRAGNQAALEKLTKSNLRFVVSVAKQYQNQGLYLTDLINEGYLGLIKAAKRFDETKGFKFISYAVWWIRQSILKAEEFALWDFLEKSRKKMQQSAQAIACGWRLYRENKAVKASI